MESNHGGRSQSVCGLLGRARHGPHPCFSRCTVWAGENLAAGTVRDTPEENMLGWWDDEFPAGCDENECPKTNPGTIGHMTQAAWYVSYGIGCATSYNATSDFKYYTVCRYRHHGNCFGYWDAVSGSWISTYAFWAEQVMSGHMAGTTDPCGNSLP